VVNTLSMITYLISPTLIASQCYTSFSMNSFKSNLLLIVAFWGLLIWQLSLFFLSLCVMLIFLVQFQMKIKLNIFSFKNILFHLHVIYLIYCSCTGFKLANKHNLWKEMRWQSKPRRESRSLGLLYKKFVKSLESV
jgi:hypothetical protein